MRRLWPSLRVLWLIVVAMPAWAGGTAPVGDADKAAIRSIIQSQMAAFQKDDAAAAFAFATPLLRTRFGSADNFMAMVRQGYQPVYRPSQVSFGILEQTADSVIQHVLVVGPDGEVHEALYFLERQPDGSWLIGGCLLTTTDLKSS
jgi:hypothetical protein